MRGLKGGGKGDRIIMHMNIMCVRAGVRICMGEVNFQENFKVTREVAFERWDYE